MHCTRMLAPTGCPLSMRLMDVKLNGVRVDSRPRGATPPPKKKNNFKVGIIALITRSVVSVASAVGLSRKPPNWLHTFVGSN